MKTIAHTRQAELLKSATAGGGEMVNTVASMYRFLLMVARVVLASGTLARTRMLRDQPSTSDSVAPAVPAGSEVLYPVMGKVLLDATLEARRREFLRREAIRGLGGEIPADKGLCKGIGGHKEGEVDGGFAQAEEVPEVAEEPRRSPALLLVLRGLLLPRAATGGLLLRLFLRRVLGLLLGAGSRVTLGTLVDRRAVQAGRDVVTVKIHDGEVGGRRESPSAKDHGLRLETTSR